MSNGNSEFLISEKRHLGRYKLFPDERNFFRDITWTDERMKHARDCSFLDRKRENCQFDISEYTRKQIYEIRESLGQGLDISVCNKSEIDDFDMS